MYPHSPSVPWLSNAGQCAAYCTTSPAAQRLAAQNDKLRPFVAANESLHPDVWWSIAKGKLRAELAATLAERTLAPEQIAWVLRDKRVLPLLALARHNTLTNEQYAALLSRQPRQPVLFESLMVLPHLPEDILNQHVDDVNNWAWQRIMRENRTVSDEWVIDQLVHRRAHAVPKMTAWSRLDSVLDDRPAVLRALLDRAASSGNPWLPQQTLTILEAVVSSRHFPGDGWTTVQGVTGEKPKFSNQRAMLLVKLLGNPNLDGPGIQWASCLVQAWLLKTGGYLREQLTEVLAARRHAGAPVTGDWDGDLPQDQQETLAALRHSSALYSHHPRVQAAGAPPYAATRQTPAGPRHLDVEAASRVPAKPATPWGLDLLEWRDAVISAMSVVDVMFADADEQTWAVFFTLAEDWVGDIGSLMQAARTV